MPVTAPRRICRLILVVLLGLFVISPGAARDDARREARVKAVAKEIDVLLAPWKQRALAIDGRGRISPLDLAAAVPKWWSADKFKGGLLGRYIRFLVTAGVCHGDVAALRKIYDLDWLLHYGLRFGELETLFLQRRAGVKNVKIPFHDRYRTWRKYTPNVSEEPQKSLRITIAFKRGDVAGALAIVPRFKRLCG